MSTQTLSEQLRDFVDGHRGWRLLEVSRFRRGRAFATREFPGAPMLLLHTDEAARHPWGADVTWGTTTDPLASTRGSFDDVEAWMDEWEKILGLPARLMECRSRRAAQVVCARTPRQQISKLAEMLGIVGTDRERRHELVSKFGPPRRRW